MSEQPKYETYLIEFKNSWEMDKVTKKMAEAGWRVVSVQTIDQGYSGAKTCCLGCLFLPLALLGKKPQLRQVLYQRVRPEVNQWPEAEEPQEVEPEKPSYTPFPH